MAIVTLKKNGKEAFITKVTAMEHLAMILCKKNNSVEALNAKQKSQR
jgi:hypothetical protein